MGSFTVPMDNEDSDFHQVLVTEWIEGQQLAKSSPEVIRKLIPVGVECFLIQVPINQDRKENDSSNRRNQTILIL